ncbi:MAG: primosomal protein N' [Bdellovibrionota bacterium]
MSECDKNCAAQVLVSGVPKPLSYAYSPTQVPVDIGSEVTIEIGRRQTKGWVVKKLSIEEALDQFSAGVRPSRPQDDAQLGFFGEADSARRPKVDLKAIQAASPGFLPEQLPLFEWMAEYYGSSLYEIIDNAVPKRQYSQRSTLFVELTEAGIAKLDSSPEWRDKLKKRSPVQSRVLERLDSTSTAHPLSELLTLGKTARAAIKKLKEQGLVELFDEASLEHLFPKAILPGNSAPVPGKQPALTDLQRSVVEKISANLNEHRFSPALLFGVTGSGKTEVYLRAIQQVLDNGGSALIVVPEIALTPQLFDQFESRLHVPLAVLHSQVGPSARWKAWEGMLRGKIRVALGARSAVFAPLQNLQLIVVDEEHESSYKQSDGLRYHARDVAVMRAKYSNCAILLGSATPSFESLVNAKRGRYQMLELPERVSSRPMPTIEVVDMNKIKRWDMPSENLSPQLHQAIEETLAKNGQVIILYNRRGFSSYLQCTSCNEVLTCPHCSVTMTYHRGKNRVLCHYCGESSAPPKYCKICRDSKTSRVETFPGVEVTEKQAQAVESVGLLEPRGAGTEKIVDEIGAQFPQARLVRLDRDTTTRKDSYRKILGSMRSGDADILVGTQMIAKGHDLPGVTLVGIIDADVGLHTPDFRSSERIYQLITQAAGRAGRGTEPGRVIVQTREPHHPTIVATVTGRFAAFARYELEYRKKLTYPPFGKLMRVVVSCPDQQDAFRAAEATRAAIDTLIAHANSQPAFTSDDESQSPQSGDVTALGPAPAPHERLRGRWRWHILVKATSPRVLSHIAGQLNQWRLGVKEFEDFRVAIDVDPYDML